MSPNSEPDDRRRGYTDLTGAASCCGFSKDRFRELINQRVCALCRPLTPEGNLLFKYSELYAANARASHGKVRLHMDAKRRQEVDDA
jgi:hypothetical protein